MPTKEELSVQEAIAIKTKYKNGDAVTFSWPPSQVDVHSYEFRRGSPSEFKKIPNYIEGVTDASGVWYYRALNESDRPLHGDRMRILEKRGVVKKQWKQELNRRLASMGIERQRAIAEAARPQWESYVKKIPETFQSRYNVMPVGFVIEVLLQENVPSVVEAIFPDEHGRGVYQQYRKEFWEPDEADAQDLHKHVTTYMDISKERKPDDTSYRGLIDSYRNNGFIVRFASYEQLKNEPACAGPDYVPEKK